MKAIDSGIFWSKTVRKELRKTFVISCSKMAKETEPKNLLIGSEVAKVRPKSTSTVTPRHKYGKLGKDKN